MYEQVSMESAFQQPSVYGEHQASVSDGFFCERYEGGFWESKEDARLKRTVS